MGCPVKTDQEKYQFFLRHLGKGLLWLTVLIGGFILFKKYVSVDYLLWLKPVYERPVIVYTIFSASELLFGIIPPEIFMIWALQSGSAGSYIQHIIMQSIISFSAGIVGFFIGRYLQHTQFFKIFKKKNIWQVRKVPVSLRSLYHHCSLTDAPSFFRHQYVDRKCRISFSKIRTVRVDPFYQVCCLFIRGLGSKHALVQTISPSD